LTASAGTHELRARLRGLGLSDAAIKAAWPNWWTEEAEESLSARVDLRFAIARHLGLEPRSLLDDPEGPRFRWHDQARFKHLSHEGGIERAAITSFGRAVGSVILEATPPPRVGHRFPARQLRQSILDAGSPFVRLIDLLALSWSLGVPVIHLRVFPWPQKRMAAMAVQVGERAAILLAKDSRYPAPVAFYLAHELGHIMLDHLLAESAIIDLDATALEDQDGDKEEVLADRFALELLTGNPQLTVLPAGRVANARELARVAVAASGEVRIEPGTLALCLAYSTGRWRTANGAMAHIYPSAKPVWREINGAARDQLLLAELPTDARDYLEAVMGARSK